MDRVRVRRSARRREPQTALALDPRDPDVVRAKAGKEDKDKAGARP